MNKRLRYFLLLILPLLITSGCVTSGHSRTRAANEMRALTIASINYSVYANALPTSFEDLADFIDIDFDTSNYELVAKGKITGYPDPSTTVLIREKQANARGERLQAFLDGSVRVSP